MTALRQKLLRDGWRLRTQAVAIGLVIACGVATYVMSVSVLHSLERMGRRYYEDYRFADIFAPLTRAPRAVAARLAEIPGVAAAAARVVAEAALDLPDLVEPAAGRLVSIPDEGPPELNRLHLRRGRWPEPDRRGEVLVNEAFAVAHRLAPGDRLQAVLHGRREPLTVTGIALSPEYVYQIRGGDLLPDDLRFGVFWMRERALAAAFDLTGACNDVVLALRPEADAAAVIAAVDGLLAPYGGRGAYGRTEQVSHRYVSDELAQLRGMASVPPAIFLLVAAFVLNVVLGRLIARQREQIATLKAFGYTAREIGTHYLQFALLIAGFGLVLGVAAGAWLGRGMADMYVDFFRFPGQDYRVEPVLVLQVTAVTLAAALLSVAPAVRGVARLAPAEAMRPAAPGDYRPAWLERFGPGDPSGWAGRMVLRQIARRPWRAAFTTTGIALAIAVMILGSFGRDMIGYVVAFQFDAVQRYDFSVGFFEPASPAALAAVAHLPGVLRAEPFRAVPVRLGSGPRSRRTTITGLAADRDLLQVLDPEARPVPLPAAGLLLAEKLAEHLGVTPGDRVAVEVLEGARPVREVEVAATLRDFSGLAAYMNLEAVHRLMREGPRLSGAWLAVDPAAHGEFYRELKRTPRVAGVVSQRASLRRFEAMMAANLLRMRLVNVIFAGIIAFGVVYNAARVTLSERAWELATLRVLGLTRGEVSAVLAGEILLLTAWAAPLGIACGTGLAALALRVLETETQRFPLVIAPATYGAALVTVLSATVLSLLVVRRRINRLDLVGVLKARD